MAFTLKPIMGPDAEPFSLMDLAGLVLVCVGFLAYSGFGFAHNFMVVQVCSVVHELSIEPPIYIPDSVCISGLT
jgi:hypothetical protein